MSSRKDGSGAGQAHKLLLSSSFSKDVLHSLELLLLKTALLAVSQVGTANCTRLIRSFDVEFGGVVVGGGCCGAIDDVVVAWGAAGFCTDIDVVGDGEMVGCGGVVGCGELMGAVAVLGLKKSWRCCSSTAPFSMLS